MSSNELVQVPACCWLVLLACTKVKAGGSKYVNAILPHSEVGTLVQDNQFSSLLNQVGNRSLGPMPEKFLGFCVILAQDRESELLVVLVMWGWDGGTIGLGRGGEGVGFNYCVSWL